MHTHQLETFVWTVRLGGVGAASRHLYVTQPAATRRIQELEKEVGAKLLRQQGRQLAPTPAGLACFRIAERILAELTNLRLAASGGGSMEGTIRIGVSEAIAVTWLHCLLRRLETSFPNFTLEIDVDLSNRLAAKLARRQIDIALLPGPVPISGVTTTSLGSCSLRWLARPELLKVVGPLTPEHLADAPIITPSQDANSYTIMNDWFARANVTPRRVSHCNSFSVLASLIRNGVGTSLLPEILFRNFIEEGTLVAVPEKPRVPRAEYWAAYLPTAEQAILPQVASFAREESWFLRPEME